MKRIPHSSWLHERVRWAYLACSGFSFHDKNGLGSVRYLFCQPMDETIKTWPIRFPAKENPNMEKALSD